MLGLRKRRKQGCRPWDGGDWEGRPVQRPRSPAPASCLACGGFGPPRTLATVMQGGVERLGQRNGLGRTRGLGPKQTSLLQGYLLQEEKRNRKAAVACDPESRIQTSFHLHFGWEKEIADWTQICDRDQRDGKHRSRMDVVHLCSHVLRGCRGWARAGEGGLRGEQAGPCTAARLPGGRAIADTSRVSCRR